MRRRGQLFKYVIPSIISMISIFLYTIIDGIFVGRGVGTDALGAVNIVFPYVMIFWAVITMFTIGGMTITAIRMGRGDTAGANISFRNSMSICIFIGIVMTLLGVFVTEPICRLLGATDIFTNLAYDYLFWYAVFLLPSGLYMFLSNAVRNDGDPLLASVAVIVATVCNIFGDWLLIFPLHMGVKGAAIATGASQCIALFILLTHFLRKNGILRFKFCKLEWSLVGKIIVRGMPECVNQFSAPVTTIAMNLVLQAYLGSIGVNVFALISYVAVFAMAVYLGVAEGIQPLFGRSYGEGNEKDLAYFLKSGMIVSLVGSAIIVAMLFVASPAIYSLFNAENETLDMAVKVTHIFSWGFLVQSLTMVITSYFYSTTRTKQAFVINALRSFVVNLVVIAVLPMIFGAEAIWFTLSVYEGIVLIVAVIMLKRVNRFGMIAGAKE